MHRIATFLFVVFVDTPSQVAGHLGETEIQMSCEVHGFIRSIYFSIWLDRDEKAIISDDIKYTIVQKMGSRHAILQNSETVPSLVSILTVHQLELSDAGTYTCEVGGNKSSVELFVGT